MEQDTHLGLTRGTAGIVRCGTLPLENQNITRGHGMCRSALIDAGDLVLALGETQGRHRMASGA